MDGEGAPKRGMEDAWMSATRDLGQEQKTTQSTEKGEDSAVGHSEEKGSKGALESVVL